METTSRKHMYLAPAHSEEYKLQSKRANKSYNAVAEINEEARKQHMSYGQYVASEWAKEHIRVRRPKEEDSD